MFVPRRTTTCRARRGLDSICTASCSITSMVWPTAVGSSISTIVTTDEGVGGIGLVDSGEVFTICGISIDSGTWQLGQLPKIPPLSAVGKLRVRQYLHCGDHRRANRPSCAAWPTTWADHLRKRETQKETT